MPEWTDEQKKAIDNTGGALLVSAAAGSGKTAVLVERVIRRLTDPVNPVDVDRMLLVTYTNAAAAEMRGKIADALTERLAKTPDDARLRRQALLVHRAQITTVHAFCLRLVREQFAALGLTPDFGIADDNTSAELREEALEQVIEEQYERGEESFFALSDLLSSGRDDKKLCDVVLQIYDRIQSHADPAAFLKEIRAVFDRPDGSTVHQKVLLEEARRAAEHGLGCLRRAIAEIGEDEELGQTYGETLRIDCGIAEKLLEAIGKGWDAAYETAANIDFPRMKSVRGYEDKEFLEYLKRLREEWKTAVKKIRERLLIADSAEIETDRQLSAPAMDALIDTVNAFTATFAAYKRERNLVDFGDLEHFAVELLLRDGKPTEIARSLAVGFDEVMVDEYQDTNGVQEAIFQAVSREGKNLFFVGDVKQSIYGFRLADPYIFLDKYRSFADEEQAEDGQPRRINLTRNFRSREEILQAANYIFGQIMSEAVGDLDYTAREALYRGADYPEIPDADHKTELLLMDTSEPEQDVEDDADEDENDTDKTVLEARMAAQRIRKLLDDGFPICDKGAGVPRPAEPRDVVILLRSVKRKAAIYRAELEAVGLTAETDENTGLLDTTEVGQMTSLLAIIDNPRQDVDLIGVLRSPLFGFTEQELAEIRLVDRNADYYDALIKAGEQGNEKVQLFLQQLARLRLLAADLPVYRLLYQIYDETGAMGLYGALPAGAQRQANLLLLLERARNFEEQSGRGLFRFCAMLRGMRERGEDFSAVGAAANGGAVRIMSIHKSKGLEFPIVVLADCAKKINEQDLKAPVLVHSKLGLGPKCRDSERGIQYPSVWRQAIETAARHEAISEELRILYVALTRPREKLIITASSTKFRSSLAKWSISTQMDQTPEYALGMMSSYLPWLVLPLMRHPAAQELRELANVVNVSDTSAPDVFSVHVVRPEMLKKEEVLRFENMPEEAELPPVEVELQYPNAFLQDIPAKMTATGFKQGYRAEEAAEDTPPVVQEIKLRQPVFDRELRGLAPTEIGTAHHLFMQYCDFDACTEPDGVERELERLRDKRILAPEQAAAINCVQIERFFGSTLYRDYFRDGRVRREFKFSVLVPAMEYEPAAEKTPDEKVLLQGVIDCLIETEEGYIVLDFKTDRVQSENAAARGESYRPQLRAYERAVREIFGRPVAGSVLYFLQAGITVWMNG